MFKRGSQLALISLLALVALGCSGVKYNSDYAPQADFGKYQTWAWSPMGNNMPDSRKYNNSIVRQRIDDGVTYAMEAKGLRQTDVESADLHVVYHGIVDQKVSYTTVNSYYGYSPYWGGYGAWGGWGGGVGASQTYAREYDEGTLIIDLLENVAGGEERLVWRGSATGTLKEANDPSKASVQTRQLIVEILAPYPPGS